MFDLSFAEITDCVDTPCMNNGHCIDGDNGYTCDCSNTGYRGELCTISKYMKKSVLIIQQS